MSGKNRYERAKSKWICVICAFFFLTTMVSAFWLSLKKSPEVRVFDNELKSVKEKVSNKKGELSDLEKSIKELTDQKTFIENELKAYEDRFDPISGEATQFDVEGKIYYCFRNEATLKSTIDRVLQASGVTYPKEAAFEINKNWSKTSSYPSDVANNMRVYKMPYVYREEVDMMSTKIKHTFILYYRDASGYIYYQKFAYAFMKE